MVRRKFKKPLKPLWKLEDGLTFSSIEKWVACREQFSLQWIDGYTSNKVSEPLEFGSIMHLCLQHQFKDSPHEVAHKVCTQYRAHRISHLRSTGAVEVLDYIIGLIKTVFPQYCTYWQSTDAGIQWVAREERFSVEHDVPTPGDARKVRLRGMRDGIYEIGKTLGIFETKTKAMVVDSQIIDGLHADMQTLLYCYCTYLTTGKYPNQVLYNVIRRPSDKSPYRRKGEQLNTYLGRVLEDVRGRPDFYFRRFEVTILREEIEAFVEKTLNPILVLFLQWHDSVKKNPLVDDLDIKGPRAAVQRDWTVKGRWSSPYHLQNCSALVGKYGRVEMWDAIFGNMQYYHIRDVVFPELDESFQINW